MLKWNRENSYQVSFYYLEGVSGSFYASVCLSKLGSILKFYQFIIRHFYKIITLNHCYFIRLLYIKFFIA